MKIKTASIPFLIVITLLLGLTVPLPATVPTNSGDDLVREDNSDQNSDEEDKNSQHRICRDSRPECSEFQLCVP